MKDETLLKAMKIILKDLLHEEVTIFLVEILNQAKKTNETLDSLLALLSDGSTKKTESVDSAKRSLMDRFAYTNKSQTREDHDWPPHLKESLENLANSFSNTDSISEEQHLERLREAEQKSKEYKEYCKDPLLNKMLNSVTPSTMLSMIGKSTVSSNLDETVDVSNVGAPIPTTNKNYSNFLKKVDEFDKIRRSGGGQ